MPKINVYLPDDLAEAVRETGVPVSAICQRALDRAVRRVTALREITGHTPGGLLPEQLAASFTRRAVAAVQSAQASAAGAGMAETGTGHLLRALLNPVLIAAKVLAALEISPAQVRDALGEHSRPGRPASSDQPGAPPLSGRLAAAVELAANESSGLGNSYIGSEHLLLGLIAEPDGDAGHALRSLGADLRVTRRTVTAALAGWSAGVSAQEQRAASNHGASAPAAGVEQLAAAIRAELEPVLARLDRLETAAS
jgi:ATP-dependent Clp protease ATP-binding subunit ClpA